MLSVILKFEAFCYELKRSVVKLGRSVVLLKLSVVIL